VGLVAAAVLAFAFLPVAFSRLALTDVGTLASVALALLGSVLALERGRPRDFVLAGAGAGLAIGFKYTAGLVLLPVGIAAAVRLARGGGRRALTGLGAALLATVAAVLVTTPFLFLNADSAWRQLAAQAGAAGSPKLG
jgi:4-amino-4-deoxy-L-arabinose transferase-like glycosyltransferase